MDITDSRELLFSNTFSHEEKDDVQLDLIQFPEPVNIYELRVVPRGQWAHPDLKEDHHFGQTTPSTVKVEFFFKSCKNDPSAIYQKMGNLDYDVEKGLIQFIPKSKITTENIVVRGRYHKLTLSIYGAVTSKRESSESPPPPPPPPPPVKDKPKEEKIAPVEEISQIETIKSTARPSDWDWNVPKSSHQEDPQFTEYPVTQDPNTLPLQPKPIEPPHPPVRRGPRTPSPPPPLTDQWEGQQEPPPAREHWSEGEAVSPGEWQTQDLWVEGQTAEPPPEEPSATWEETETWETTDSWEPQESGDWEGAERGEEWKRGDQGRRKSRGPRTPPGEPRSPKSYDSKRKRRRPREPDPPDSSKRRRRKPDEFTEPLSPERPVEPFPSGGAEQEDPESEERMGEVYEEISDEEVIDDGFLENMDIDSLDTGGDVTPFDPFQAELEPLKVLGCQEYPGYRELATKTDPLMEGACVEEESEESTKLQNLLESLAKDRGPKWVAALEEIPKLLNHKPLSGDKSDKICDWTVQALDYTLAQSQPIAVNIRQLKAGLKLVSCLCSSGEQMCNKLMDMDVLGRLLSLLFEDHMASSLKLLIFKALDSSTNWQVGLDKFLSSEDPVSSGYKRLLKFLMTEQTVRVTQAGTAILQMVHLYEVLGTLKDTVNKVISSTPVKADSKETEPPTQGTEPHPPSIDEETPDNKTQTLEADYPSLDEALMKRLMECLEEILNVFKTDACSIKQPTAKFFPTTAVPTKEEGEDVWPTLYHLFAKRGLLPSLTLLLCCPSTASDLSLVSTIREILIDIAGSFQGMLLLASQPETIKVLFQALTGSEEEDTDDASLHQVAMEIIHKMAAVRVLDSLMLKLQSGDHSQHRENMEIVEDLQQAFSLTFNPIGRQALADVFSKEDNLKYLLCLMKPKEISSLPPEEQPKKNAVDGYLRHLLVMILQYSEDINLLKKHSEALKSYSNEKDLLKWVSPLTDGPFDTSMVRPLVEFLQGCCDDMIKDFTNSAPGILTSLRILHYLTCVPETMKTGGQQKVLSYQLATIEAFSSGAITALSTCVKKVSDLLLRPWQMGHCLTSRQQHLAETISLLSLKIMKVILVAVFNTGQVQFKDDRPISSAISLYTVMCCAPPSGSLDKKPQEIHQLIIDILLTYTTAPPTMPDSTQALSQGCWNMMLKVMLEYLPTSLYTYLGGLSLLSDLLPLPLPLQTHESLSADDVAQIHQHRKLWSIHVLCQGTAIKKVISELAYTSSPVLQHMLRRVLCQIADLSATTASLVVRSVLEAATLKLAVSESGAMEPTLLEAAQVFSLFVYLIPQPSIKGAFLHLIRADESSEDPLADILKKLLMIMNIPFESPSQLQAQECVVATLQSLCSPDITLLSEENLSMVEQLANSLPGKEDMNLIATYLLDHVTGADHSYASILPALRMIASLLDHDYGFASVKGALLKQEGLLSAFYKRLTEGFNKDSSDYLSTLSTAVDFLHFLTRVESYYDEEQPDAVRYRTQALSAKELRSLVGWEKEDHSLKQLEKILVDCCKEDEKLESLLDSLSSLTQLLEAASPPEKAPENIADLPPSKTLAEQFDGRIVFYVSEEEDDRLVPGIWIGLPPTEEVDTEPEMVKCDLEEIRLRFFPEFNLKAELEKGFLTEERTQEKPRRNARRYTALTSRGRGQFSNTIRRAHNVGFRGGKRNYDLFRQRAQNTSRPPSMHVDDFMNIENTPNNDNNQYNRNQPSRRGDGGSPGGHRGSRGGFRPWSGPFRRDGPPRGMPMRGRGQWGPGRKPMRSNYHQGPQDRNYMPRRPDPRSEGRPPPRSPMGGPQAFNRPGSADRMRGPYRGGMRGMGPRGSPSPRRGGGGGGRGYRGGHWTADPHMRPQGKGMRGRPPPPPGRHSRSFTR